MGKINFGQIAQDAAGGIIDTGMGLILGGYNDRRQLKQQQKLQDMQIKGQQQMTDYNMMKQLEMWKNTSYGPQMEMMKKAGLNPGLMYGMSGGGGATTGNASGNVSGGTAPSGGREVQDIIGMGIQRELLQAQKENIQANTAKTKAETGNVPLTGENIQASTGSLLQGIQNAKAVEVMTKIQSDMAEMTKEIQGESMNNVRATLMYNLRKIYGEMESAEAKGYIDQATKNDKIKQIQAEALGETFKNELLKAGKLNVEANTANTQQQTFMSKEYGGLEIMSKIKQGWINLELGERGTYTKEGEARLNEYINDVQKSTQLPIEVVKEAIQAIILRKVINPGQPARNPVGYK